MAEWLERNRSNLAAVLVVLVTVVAVTLAQLPRRSALQVISPAAAPPTIKVHVVGSVLSPGVYQLAADARIEDALKAAGGPTGTADLAPLNLATPLKDGQQVVIPSMAEKASAVSPEVASFSHPSPSPTPKSVKLDLNSASRTELEALPGIGPVTAQKILDYRQKGRIGSLEELRDAKVVNSSMYEKIRDLVEAR